MAPSSLLAPGNLVIVSPLKPSDDFPPWFVRLSVGVPIDGHLNRERHVFSRPSIILPPITRIQDDATRRAFVGVTPDEGELPVRYLGCSKRKFGMALGVEIKPFDPRMKCPSNVSHSLKRDFIRGEAMPQFASDRSD